MANLITCKTCGSKISSSAAACPYCGHPHEKDRAEKKNMQQILILVATLAVFVLLFKLGWLEPMVKYLLNLFKK
jgi:predicted nucleic acid-binding Zn ribbon protein